MPTDFRRRDFSLSRFREALKTFLFWQWDHSTVATILLTYKPFSVVCKCPFAHRIWKHTPHLLQWELQRLFVSDASRPRRLQWRPHTPGSPPQHLLPGPPGTQPFERCQCELLQPVANFLQDPLCSHQPLQTRHNQSTWISTASPTRHGQLCEIFHTST